MTNLYNIIRSTISSLCFSHFRKAKKNVVRDLKKAGLNIASSAKPAQRFHLLVGVCLSNFSKKKSCSEAKCRRDADGRHLMCQSFHYCKYTHDANQLSIFADDVFLRWLRASHHVDFDTMAGADKFGNVYFVRLRQYVSDEISEDPTGGKIKWEQGKLNEAFIV
ncbi:hypothetical protein Nepgr_025046 [Nepenthes gracilis]|uniref:RSE1/DDB1/CPSF1 C-terminal domain-containing protein n=1 Tax=Nepenthes gracilis TaxID=150966 RepID=A0AAD3XZC1_NEPGR|nr:hypothetical protein Nepgr_025046 [Nepenthes gracilis]